MYPRDSGLIVYAKSLKSLWLRFSKLCLKSSLKVKIPALSHRTRQGRGTAAATLRMAPELERFTEQNQADPLCRVTGPRMNPSVDVGRSPRPFRHLRMAEHRSPDPSSSRAPVHSALVQISVTRYHQPRRSAFTLDARQIGHAWQVRTRRKLAGSLQLK